MRADHYAALARQFATYARSHGGNELYRIAAGANIDDYAWTEALMRAIDGLEPVDGAPRPFQAVSVHAYTHARSWKDKGRATGFTVEEWYTTLSNASRMDELLTRHSAVMQHYDPHGKVGLVVDEWGTWFEPESGTNPHFLFQQNTLRDALVASIHFDIFHRHAQRVVMANLAQTVNVLQAVLLTDAQTGAVVKTPTFHVFEMNRGHHDAWALDVDLVGVPSTRVRERELALLSASASTVGDSALVSLTNLDPAQDRRVMLDLRGREIAGFSARVLTASRLDAHNSPDRTEVEPEPWSDIARTDSGLDVVVPAHGYVTVKVDLA
ncbi:alpha-L-arabinofuranosidase C-terminal domain-containing protein [Demequina sp. NBRC 110055]|uniref:alpha-L-arabinofuranosidase C-terminal domain-containing protein n=1 Tax=Demequina sp. NBRC 110055 TaxID=1570344 RepID=UPI0027D85207|nr:alpha-L-arabinofuranosidase C-terminal domain-containing protein [Demequina sp. NBRC 110055]